MYHLHSLGFHISPNSLFTALSCSLKAKATSSLFPEVSLRLTVSFAIEHPYDTCDQILLPFGMLLSEICSFVSVGRHLWREDESAICSVITKWSQSLRTRNHTLLSHLRLPQTGVSVSHIYIPQEEGGPIIPPGTGLPLRLLLRLAGLRWRCCNPPPTWRVKSPYVYPSGTGWCNLKSKSDVKFKSQSHVTTDIKTSMSWCLFHAALERVHPNEFQSNITLVH
jgi:hypothetical protein